MGEEQEEWSGFCKRPTPGCFLECAEGAEGAELPCAWLAACCVERSSANRACVQPC